MDKPIVHTIGHSTHSAETFLALLEAHEINAVADVRSAPYSRFQPHFNRESLGRLLREHGIHYVFLGDALGGRSRSAADYENGRVVYARLAKSAGFQAGVDRLVAGTARYRISLLCAEKEPLECHRTLLVAPEVERRGCPVAHIHGDGGIESHDQAMARLLAIHGIQGDSLFNTREELIRQACDLQEKRVAFVDPQLRAPEAARTS